MVKVTKSKIPPASLATEKTKSSGLYNKEDVIRQLKSDFHNKCYLCNLKDLPDIEVEHLIPHKGSNNDLKFDWNNLFLSCPHCNNMKNQIIYDGKIINCCETDPEEFLAFSCVGNSVEINSKNDDETTICTAKLLTEIFNKTNTGIRINACEHRVEKLKFEMNLLYKVLEKYKENSKKLRTVRALKGLLSKESQFAAFKRSYIKQHRHLYDDIESLLS